MRFSKVLTLSALCRVLKVEMATRRGRGRREELHYRYGTDADCFSTWLSLGIKVLYTGRTTETPREEDSQQESISGQFTARPERPQNA